MHPTISVLITYYNERELLTMCLRSLAAQSVPPHEILIYDDASTYPAADYVPAGMATQVICGSANHGPAYGRNVLLHASSGDYVHFHDADDLFVPHWCERVGMLIAQSETALVFTEIESFTEHGVHSSQVLGLDRLLRDSDLLRFCIRGSMLVPSGTYRRSAVVAIGGYRETIWQAEDYDFHMRLAASQQRYELILDPLVRIRLRPEGRSVNRHEVWSSAAQVLALQSTELPARYRPDLADAAARVGSQLFRLHAHAQARDAFRLARRLGRPTFSHQQRAYRIIARALGPTLAEWASHWYRHSIPEPLRRRIR